MMLKKNGLLLLALVVVSLLQAQKTELPALPPHFKIRVNPLAVLEPDMQATAGVEWRFRPKFSLGMDVSYIFWRYTNAQNDNEPVSGFKLRPEFRYYFQQNPKTDWFVAAEGSYKQVSTSQSEEVCVSNGAATGCSYFQRIDYREVKKAPGFAAKVGFQQYFGSNRRIYYEVFLGIGFKVISVTKKGYQLPEGARNGVIINDGLVLFEEGFAPHLPAGIKFGIRL